ncbi:MAG TPA: aspartate aminotransferase family protein [Candidatus Acidoferrales bacterium]|nr:aspartate aminotransferase family protein [Candidatus Acidoferrales bacterium]HEV2223377.1 aspartate aminotransferase family protein [Candidatus Acidoferrales bacterium]
MPSKKVSDAQILRDADQYMVGTYRRPPIVFTHGKGCRLYDMSGRTHLDFLGGIAVNALGYSHPRLVRVMRREAAQAVHFSNLFHNSFQGPLAKKLAEWSGLERVFFTNSGTEAMEGAMKLARAYSKKNRVADGPEKTRFLALENSFHGRTFGAVSITYPAKYREPFEPVVPGAEFVRFNDVADLERRFDESVCAIVLETIQGEGGVYPVSESFWSRARELATRHNAAMIADEIQCGLGRTGRKFAYQKFTTKPDIVTVAKPLAGGLPLGAFIANEKFASAFTPGLHGTTFGGGPFVCAVALEFLKTLEDENLLANVRERGEELRQGLEKLQSRFEFIREVRGEGLIVGLDLSIEGGPIVEEALKRGLIINCTHEHILRMLPPFTIRARDIREFLKLLEVALAAAPRKAWEPGAAQRAAVVQEIAGAKAHAAVR